MISVSIVGWLAFATLVALSTLLGAALANAAPFTDAFGDRLVRRALGIGLAPFLLGLAATSVLRWLPGQSHVTHYMVVAIGLAAIVAIVAWVDRRRPRRPSASPVWSSDPRKAPDRIDALLLVLLVVAVCVLLVDATILPLVQGDSLEYSTAARRLYALRTLASYPPIDPVGDPSGFYGPWTHPPLFLSLFYLANVCQGNADAPGLLRLLSPWALIASTIAVYALGACQSRRSGLLAALLLIATPSMLLGADSALPDAFTVLGLTLTLLACAGFDVRRMGGVVAIGLITGVAMWAHSQAVLLVPLVVFGLFVLAGSERWRPAFFVRCAAVVLAAFAVGAWPYLRNLRQTGALISDNPVVFALPTLDWTGFFRSERNLDSVASRIQYGILKGWFAFDAFGLVFWFMTAGIAVLAVRWRRSAAHAQGAVDRVTTACVAFLVCYFGGVVVSTALGVDLMIKSERYFLVILPVVALLAALGLDRWDRLAPSVPGSSVRLGRVVLAAIPLMFVVELPALFLYRARRLGIGVSTLAAPLPAKLTGWDAFGVIDAIGHSAPGSVVLSMKPSDMFYTGRKMVSYLDPRMLPVYDDQSPSSVAARLRGLNVSLVHVPPYALPPLYNSKLEDVLADPAMARLEHSSFGYQLYRLTDGRAPAGRLCEAREVGPGSVPWTWESNYVFGGVKRLLSAGHRGGSVRPAVIPHAAPVVFQRDRPTVMRSSNIQLTVDPTSRRELELRASVLGRGAAHFYIEQFGADRRELPGEDIGGTVMRTGEPTRSYARRFIVDGRARSIRVQIEYRGASEIGVAGVSLSRVCI